MGDAILYEIRVDDKGTPIVKKFGGTLKGAKQDAGLLSTAMGDIKSRAESLGIPISGAEKYVGKFGAAAIGGVAAVGALGAGIYALANHAVQAGADLQDLADTTGLSVEELSSMRGVLAASNMDIKGYADAVSKLEVRLTSNSKAFKQMGVDISDPSKAFDQIKRKIADIQDPIERSRIANEAFGKSFRELMPLLTMSNAEYDKLKGNTSVFSSEFAANAAEVDDSIAALKLKFGDFAVALGTNFLPMMQKIVDLLADAADYWGAFSNGPSQDEINAKARDEIHTKYAELQARSDAGARAWGQEKAAPVRIDGKTEFQAQMAYTESLRAAAKAKDEEAKQGKEARAKEKELTAAQQRAADALDAQAKEAKAYADFLKSHSYATFVKAQERQNTGDTMDASNQARWDAERGQSVDYYGGNDTLYRDEQERANEANKQAFNRQRYQEHQMGLDEQDKEDKRVAQLVELQQINEEAAKFEESINRINAAWGLVSSNIAAITVGPLEDFYKHIGSNNKSLGANFSSLWSNIQDGFGNMLAKMAAEMTAKAATFGLLNLLSGGGAGWATSMLSSFSFFAGGTNSAPGGWSIVGENGPEALFIPQGAKVRSNEDTQAATQGNRSLNITINQAPGMSEDDVVRTIRRYEKLGVA